MRHYVHILSNPVTVCNIPFHFWALWLDIYEGEFQSFKTIQSSEGKGYSSYELYDFVASEGSGAKKYAGEGETSGELGEGTIGNGGV